jgi:hypothetical protein
MSTLQGEVFGFDIDAVVGDLRRAGTDNLLVEAKSAAGGMPKSIANTMSAFANTPGGGTIILGLDEQAGFTVVRLSKPSDLASGLASIGARSTRSARSDCRSRGPVRGSKNRRRASDRNGRRFQTVPHGGESKGIPPSR